MEMVLNNKGIFRMTEYVKIENDVHTKIRDDVNVNVRANGRWMPIAILTFVIAVATMSVGNEIAKSNDLRRQELEVAKKQYQLDSLRYYAPFANQQVKQK